MLIAEYRQLVEAAEVAHEKAMEDVGDLRAEADYMEMMSRGSLNAANSDLAKAEQEALEEFRKEGAP